MKKSKTSPMIYVKDEEAQAHVKKPKTKPILRSPSSSRPITLKPKDNYIESLFKQASVSTSCALHTFTAGEE
ncbi:hypothetical protein QYF36_005607 [Acer negundo]|nr:hypothetical protein QYF36_005607 [Acer negundo]